MARDWNIGRDDADVLIETLEAGDPSTISMQRLLLGDELRELFGYVRLKDAPSHLENLGYPLADIERAKVVARRLSDYSAYQE